jgi:outer membrane protein, multidrug efflux system
MRSAIARLANATLCAFLGACTLEPTYHRPDSPVPVPAGVARAGIAAADIGWREFFVDPQLQQLLALALANNRDLRVAALNVQSAQAQYRIQRSDLFPTVDASAEEQLDEFPAGVLGTALPGPGSSQSGSAGSSETTFRFYDVGIGFTSYELDFFGRIRSLNHAALQQYFSYGETRRSIQLTLVAEVAAAYLAVLTDQTLLDIARETRNNQNDSYALTERMFRSGTSTELALRQAESTVDTARASVAQYNRQLAQDRNALQMLLGTPLPDTVDFAGGLDRGTVVTELDEGIPSEVLVRRPDVLAAERQLQAANAQIGAARAAFLPAISLTGSFGTASTELSGLFKGDSRTWTFSPQFSVPLFAGGALVANLQATKIARRSAVARYEQAIQTAFREIADALVARGTLDEQLQAQQSLVATTSQAYRLAQMRFRGGVDSYLNTLDAQRVLFSARQQLQGVRLMRLQNLVTLYKALGGGLLEHTAAAAQSTPPAT